MGVRCIPLIAGPRQGRPTVREALLEEVHRLKERRGEMLAAVDEETGTVQGTIGLSPGKDGTFQLTRIEIETGCTTEGVDALLLEEAGRFLRHHRAARLKFGTSPLLTRSAELYITRFGSRYHWREGTRTPEGQPWPFINGECDFDDPLARPLDLREDEVAERSVLEWNGGRPNLRSGLVYSGPLSVLVPDIDAAALTRIRRQDPDVIATVYSAFHSLHIHGYGFAWFDKLSPAAAPGEPSYWYYVMNRVVAF
jgi:hypothetical protein